MWLSLRDKLLVILILYTGIIYSQPSDQSVLDLIDAGKYELAIREADVLIQNTENITDAGRLVQLQADAYYYLNDIDSSLNYYLRAVDYYEKAKEKISLNYMESISHVGFCYRELGKMDQAVIYYRRALGLAVKLQDSVEIASQYSNLGTTYSRIGEIELSLEHLNKAYQIDLVRKDTSAIGFDIRSIADIHMLSENYSESIKYYRQSLELLELSSGNANSHALRLGSLGNAFLGLASYDSAEFYLNQSLDELIDLGDSLNAAVRWVSMARLEYAKGSIIKANRWGEKARDFFSEIDESNHLISVNEVLSDITISQGKFQQAMRYVDQNARIAKQQGLLIAHRNAQLQKSIIYEHSRQTGPALKHHQLYKSLDDSLRNINASQALSEMQVRYEVDRVEQQNSILSLENEVTKAENERKSTQLFWAIIVGVLFMAAGLIISWSLQARHKLKQQLLLSEIDSLSDQIKLVMEGDGSSLNIDLVNAKLDSPLSVREFEILEYVISDMNNGEIAEKTSVSINTVKYHLKNIYEKLGVGNRKEVLQFAINSSK